MNLRHVCLLLLASVLISVTTGCAPATLGKVAIGLAATQIPTRHRPIRVDSDRIAPSARPKHIATPVFVDPIKMQTSSGKYHRTIEKHFAEIDPDFSLYTVEFDDQGNFWNRPQALKTIDCAMSEASNEVPPAGCRPDPDPNGVTYPRQSRPGALFLTLVHGWKHGCQSCDTNLTCWREQLRLVAQLERDSVAQHNAQSGEHIEPRRVVGIYVAWRGKRNIWRQYILDDFDFVDRKEVAHRIGRADGPKFFSELDARLKALHTINPSQMFTFGHSFGGAFLYSSIHSLFQKNQADARAHSEIIPSLGDQVMLLNPAFEALIYEDFHYDSKNGAFQPHQQPVLLNVTSRSDWVTHYVFPLGRIVFLPLQIFQIGNIRRGERMPYFTAAGHLKRHRTHELDFRNGDQPIQLPPLSNAAKINRILIGLVGLRPTYQRNCKCEVELTKFKNDIETTMPTPSKRANLKSAAAQYSPAGAGTIIGDFELHPQPGFAAQMPYFVVYADSKIIDGHGDIFNPNFVKFLAQYLSLYRRY